MRIVQTTYRGWCNDFYEFDDGNSYPVAVVRRLAIQPGDRIAVEIDADDYPVAVNRNPYAWTGSHGWINMAGEKCGPRLDVRALLLTDRVSATVESLRALIQTLGDEPV